MTRTWSALAAALMLSPAARADPLRLEAFLQGHLTGTGEVDNRRDGTRRPFTTTMQGTWSGPHGTVTEDLTYADGEAKRFVWHFDVLPDGRTVGHRDDLVGTAAVVTEGDTVRMIYQAHTKVPLGAVLTLSFDDRFSRGADGSVTLQGEVSYLLVTVATTHMTIRRTGP